MPRGANKIDMLGRIFGHLIVTRELEPKKGKTTWLCICECGKEHVASGGHLRRGLVPSCGCLKSEKTKLRNTTHGLSKTKAFQVWADMLARCQNPNHRSFHNYGGRGITVDERWQSLDIFIADMGEPVKGLELDRKDNNKGYSESNCRWVTHKENCRNTRRSILYLHDGELRTLVEWAEIYKINTSTLYHRIKRGWSLLRSLSPS